MSSQNEEPNLLRGSISAQLMTLGYGRGELHPSDEVVVPFDPHLKATQSEV